MWKDVEVKRGLHHVSGLSQLLFIIAMDVLVEEAVNKPPWTIYSQMTWCSWAKW